MGAGSIRIVQGIFKDKLTLKEVYRFDNHIEWIDGADRWNLEAITRGIYHGLEKALAESEIPIVSVAVDSWGVDFVLLDGAGSPLEDPVSYRDGRTNGMRALWESQMGELETFRLSGINYNVFNTLYQLLSLKGSSLLDKTGWILFMADYINYVLSGKATNEITLSATSQMVNCTTGNWDPQILGLLGLKDGLLAKPILPGTRLGFLKDFGKPTVEVIAAAGHDTACAVAAIPWRHDNFAFLSTGTWCIIGMVSAEPFVTREAYEFGITNERAANGQFRPLKNLMGLWLIQQLRLAFGSRHSFAEIDQMASQAPVSEALIDPSDPVFYNPGNMKQAFDDYLKQNNSTSLSTEASYYRCAYDSLVLSFSKTLKALESLRGKPFDCLHLFGGGSQSELLCRLTARGTGKKVISGPVEAAVTGNILIQAKALGYIASEDAARNLVCDSVVIREYLPD
jgi:rhamnulokinase